MFRRSLRSSVRSASRPAVSSAGVTSFRSSIFTNSAPVSVTIGSLTPPDGSANAAASIVGLTPMSGIGEPRAISSVVFTSTPAAFAALSKSPDLNDAMSDAAFCRAPSTAFCLRTSSCTFAFTSSSFGM